MKNEPGLQVLDEVKGAEKAGDRLERLGLKTAAATVKRAQDLKRKLAVAYENYRYVRQEKIDAYQARLKKATLKGEEPYNASWKRLDFTPLEQYGQIPPEKVLVELEKAHGMKCFDHFEVAHIREVKDPILFGRVDACPDRFFVAQWDEDVNINQILKENEG